MATNANVRVQLDNNPANSHREIHIYISKQYIQVQQTLGGSYEY